ncbi:hypothetical protein [Amycolatopsis azurea]|uniref:DUF3168 domain-containing protein n=1 Tax=Amycolatopsis azurea DSM 43854 TaxID=1238180 RepID=A0ABX3J544_9PSEU|nr:hypothetical protein [Amycolatopsis azurea]OOC02148.1 hypothetical protein B0293_34825 [Amycolatopsis azurea DSM 43854]
MRSVFVYPHLDQVGTVAVLDALSPGQNAPWLVEGVLYCWLESEDEYLYQGWEPDGVEHLTVTIGHRPDWAIEIEVSGRVDGTEQLRRLVLTLLEHGGVVTDDYSDHAWTAGEIRSHARHEGLTFFDFRGSYNRLI